eukprot:1150021-Pelagomonas_calceolata.AAC.1
MVGLRAARAPRAAHDGPLHRLMILRSALFTSEYCILRQANRQASRLVSVLLTQAGNGASLDNLEGSTRRQTNKLVQGTQAGNEIQSTAVKALPASKYKEETH